MLTVSILNSNWILFCSLSQITTTGIDCKTMVKQKKNGIYYSKGFWITRNIPKQNRKICYDKKCTSKFHSCKQYLIYDKTHWNIFFQTYQERILFMHPLKLSRIPTTSQVFLKKFLHFNVDRKTKQSHWEPFIVKTYIFYIIRFHQTK